MFAITSSLLLVALAGVAQTQYGAPAAAPARAPVRYAPPPPPAFYPPRPFGYGYGPYGPHGHWDFDGFDDEPIHDRDCHKLNTTAFSSEKVIKVKYFEYRDVEYAILSCTTGSTIRAVNVLHAQESDVLPVPIAAGDNFVYISKCGKHGRFTAKLIDGAEVALTGAYCV